MGKITLTRTDGPHDYFFDYYDFTLNREMTLQEFLDLIISTNDGEWGCIAFSCSDDPIAEYICGKITVLNVEDTSFKIKTTGTAVGLWNIKSYYISRK